MVRNEFACTLYRTTTDMLDAMAEAWLSGGGACSEETQREFLAESSDAELAADAIAGWKLDGRQGEEPHMEINEYSASDLAAAFGRLRERIQAAR